MNRSTSLETKPISPLKYFKPEWEITKESVRVDDLVVRHDFQSPYQTDFRKTDRHCILYQLSDGTHQVTHIGNEEYIGTFATDEFFLHPAYYSGFYSWKTTDETISFILKPDFLCNVAEQSERSLSDITLL